MKPFDYTKAKQGHPVCTRDGKPVRILCYDRASAENYCIVALIKVFDDFEDIKIYPTDGHYNGHYDSNFDLMMVTEKHEGWINIKRIGDDPVPYGEGVFESESKAKEVANIGSSREKHIATLKIEWEE